VCVCGGGGVFDDVPSSRGEGTENTDGAAIDPGGANKQRRPEARHDSRTFRHAETFHLPAGQAVDSNSALIDRCGGGLREWLLSPRNLQFSSYDFFCHSKLLGY